MEAILRLLYKSATIIVSQFCHIIYIIYGSKSLNKGVGTEAVGQQD